MAYKAKNKMKTDPPKKSGSMMFVPEQVVRDKTKSEKTEMEDDQKSGPRNRDLGSEVSMKRGSFKDRYAAKQKGRMYDVDYLFDSMADAINQNSTGKEKEEKLAKLAAMRPELEALVMSGEVPIPSRSRNFTNFLEFAAGTPEEERTYKASDDGNIYTGERDLSMSPEMAARMAGLAIRRKSK